MLVSLAVWTSQADKFEIFQCAQSLTVYSTVVCDALADSLLGIGEETPQMPRYIQPEISWWLDMFPYKWNVHRNFSDRELLTQT
jgi:hypothetical protein